MDFLHKILLLSLEYVNAELLTVEDLEIFSIKTIFLALCT